MRKQVLTFTTALILIIAGCKDETFKKEWTSEQAPEKFTARFETNKGDFDIEVTRKYSPEAADRFFQLVKHRYYDNAIFYRVVPGFVAQFGNTDSKLIAQWQSVTVPDEQVRLTNRRGTISFARFGKESRDTEVFINLSDNTTLDTLLQENIRGFPAFGQVKSGMETVDQLYSGYGERTMSDGNLYSNRTAFYQRFPKLDLIKKAYLLE